MIEHPETERADPIAGDVRAAWRDGRERYGARKIKAAPERRGVTASSRRIGNIMREHEQAAEEGARVPEPLHHDRAAEARPQRLRGGPTTSGSIPPPGYRSPKEFTEQGPVL